MDPLAHEPFGYLVTKQGQVRITFEGREVTVVAGRDALRLTTRLAAADGPGVQQLLARATGNFKRGNERREG
ncbi:MAG: hypothetical protein ABMA64_17990 [Myxococcota bacterium]